MNVYRNAGNSMKIAVIGTGIAGNVVAYKLRQQHDITVYEAAAYIGGHSNTIDVCEKGEQLAIDTGFIVFNDRTYPEFIQLLKEIGQESQRSEMSFSVRAADGKLEYNGKSLNSLFVQRSNIWRPGFYRMLRDILRFNAAANFAAEGASADMLLRDFLQTHRFRDEFVDHYLVPMAAAIWSAEPAQVMDMPVKFLVQFFANHGLLQLQDRPEWRVISGGSRSYVNKLVAGHRDRIRLNSAVNLLRRTATGVELHSASAGSETFDAVFVACHSDQALQMLATPSALEREVLGAIPYQLNEAVLHSDPRVMPLRRKAWAAWNYHLPRERMRQVAVTYNMNILQGLDAEQQYCVTLNDTSNIDPGRIIKRIQYAHPVFTSDAIAAQSKHRELNSDRVFYCGAYWRNGFHEDGVVSALAALQHFEEWLRYAELHLRRAS